MPITAELLDGFSVEISNGTHTWRADEPLDIGGSDTGPNPYDLLLGAVAACTVITLSSYAKRKNIDISSISAEYHYQKVHVDDCVNCDDDRTGMVDHITSHVFIDGNFDEATRRRLEDIARRCPVHRTLENGVVFNDIVFAG
jgi:putative redox protein